MGTKPRPKPRPGLDSELEPEAGPEPGPEPEREPGPSQPAAHGEAAADSVDRLLASWNETRPDLDLSPVAIFARVNRLNRTFDAELETTFNEHGLNAAEFYSLVTLRRLGEPDGVSQRRLMRALNLSSGTISTRVDRLVERGLVTRDVDPADRRNSRVALTAQGIALFERVTPAHIATENRLLAALDPTQRDQLIDLLRALLVSLEGTNPEPTFPRLGFTLAPAHVTMAIRRAAGLPETVGLIVRAVEPGGRAEQAGTMVGDVLTSADEQPLRSIASLYAAINNAAEKGVLPLGVLRGEKTPATLRLDIGPRPGDQPQPTDIAPSPRVQEHQL
ncbi:MarR family transcriptional regulator [Catenulispora pinisilvae]|uniref:MarR family transcriptional regulator n=1 Tax=Catenulispora pinisilvae TaxID=2705253 RepID=UPI0018926A56|nr:MarR family transcriptional regulator [Catenulispora pinisilvae]